MFLRARTCLFFSSFPLWEKKGCLCWIVCFVLDLRVFPSLFLISVCFSSLWKWICLGKASGIITPLHLFPGVAADLILDQNKSFHFCTWTCVVGYWEILENCTFSYQRSLFWCDLMACSGKAHLEKSLSLFLLVWFLCQPKHTFAHPYLCKLSYYRLTQVS